MQAESDENAEREPLKPSEASDLARKMEAVLKPLAAERQSPGTNQHNEVRGNLPPTSEPKSRDIAAKTAGFSEGTIRKVRTPSPHPRRRADGRRKVCADLGAAHAWNVCILVCILPSFTSDEAG